MARKRRGVFHIQPLLNRHTQRKLVIYSLFSLLAALLCTTVSPVMALAPAVNTVPISIAQSPSLLERGKILYDEGKFTDAVKVLQQAIPIYQTQGDRLRQALSLTNLSLTYQQMGLRSLSEQAIADSLKSIEFYRR